MQWYYARSGEQFGPFPEETLIIMARDGRLRRSDHVWHAGMGDTWAPAGTVPGLFPEAGAVPPQQPAAPLNQRAPLPGSTGISVTQPANRAWARMKHVLFSPFDMTRWLGIGFGAWLATLFEGGGGNYGGSGGGEDLSELGSFEELIDKAGTFYEAHREMIMGIGAVAITLGLLFSLLFIWLRSRGKFMLLDNLINNRDLVKQPWARFRQDANSLFRWTFGLSVVASLCWLALLAAAVVWIALPCFRARAFLEQALPAVIAVAAVAVIMAIVFAYIQRFLEDFIVPIMYRDHCTATEAWRTFGAVYQEHAGKFILYGLFYLLLTIGAGAAVIALIICTCCIAGCLLAIPYLGAVAMLPVTVFFRFYSLEYLAQYGNAFVIGPRADPPTP